MKKINQFFIRIKTNLAKTKFLVAVFSLLLLSCNKKLESNSQQEESVIVVVQDLSMSLNPSSTEITQERKFVSRFLEKEMSSNFDLMVLYSNSTSNSVTNNFKIEWQASEKVSSGYQSKSAKMLEESVMESENEDQKSAMIGKLCKKLFDEMPKQKSSQTEIIELLAEFEKQNAHYSNVKVLFISDMVQSSNLSNWDSDFPKDKKDAESKAQIDTEKLKKVFGLSDSALSKVSQISVLIPASVDKEKTITPQYYYQKLFENFSYRKPIEWHSL
ncbi:hypothetical protein CHRY9390_01581 [Chryseobacterium aquaeductus]|uniref:Uncharacterized protein n=1 Tax=Chryseobacterium aquaeductus TaxID=2675056 RepID=A0A9N8MGU5_9FLAO|nr:hypothetical protein [Chryseobacterium aquaeductus]CAA7330902.1 hypothetical protein CHRY9390_01581 [Chryseobacterium potabilaquae]CAD7806892.1 hypothetical protein CHRY9390_01581 [Chryseobacterium aquaeductus]